MAIAYDNTTTNAFDDSTTSFSHTATGSDLCAVVGVVIDSTQTVSTITYGGTNMTLGKLESTGFGHCYIYYLAGISSGSSTVAVTLSGSQDAGVIAMTYTGVDQTTPLDQTVSTADGTPFTGAPHTITMDLTSVATNAMCVDVWAIDANTTAYTAGSGQTEVVDTLAGSGAGDFDMVASYESSSGTVTMSWDGVANGDNYMGCAISLNPAATSTRRIFLIS